SLASTYCARLLQRTSDLFEMPTNALRVGEFAPAVRCLVDRVIQHDHAARIAGPQGIESFAYAVRDTSWNADSREVIDSGGPDGWLLDVGGREAGDQGTFSDARDRWQCGDGRRVFLGIQ